MHMFFFFTVRRSMCTEDVLQFVVCPLALLQPLFGFRGTGVFSFLQLHVFLISISFGGFAASNARMDVCGAWPMGGTLQMFLLIPCFCLYLDNVQQAFMKPFQHLACRCRLAAATYC